MALSTSALKPLLSELHGHAYTIGPRLWYGRRVKPPRSLLWQTRVREGLREIVLSGLYSQRERADTLVVLMHGCGGTPDSHYVVLAANHFFGAGHSVLRMAWRGADMRGEDLYHAAQTSDLHTAIAEPTFARYQRIWLVGYSLGGHCVLHVAHENRDPRVRAVAAICPVLHLIETNLAVDSPRRAMYRRYVLGGLFAGYGPLHARGLAPSPLDDVRRAYTFREYDALTVVPRYGFESVEDYYTRACVSRVLSHIKLPSLVVVARHDPLLPWQIAERVRPTCSPSISFRWAERGGHAGFPRDLDLGERGERGLEPQVATWLNHQ